MANRGTNIFGSAAAGLSNSAPAFNRADTSNLNINFGSGSSAATSLRATASAASTDKTKPTARMKTAQCSNCENMKEVYRQQAIEMQEEHQAAIDKKNRKLDNQATMNQNALTGQRDSFKASKDALKSENRNLQRRLDAAEAKADALEDQADLDEEAHAQEISETIAAYEKEEERLNGEVNRLEAELRNASTGDDAFVKQIKDGMGKLSGVFEDFNDASAFIPEVVQQVLRMKGRQQYDIDLIKDATTTLRENGFAGDEESYIEDSIQIILNLGRERRLLTAERDGLRTERDGFLRQATEAATLADLSCPKDQVIPSLVQIATNLSTQVKSAQDVSNNMVAGHAEEVRRLKLAVEDEQKTTSDFRGETLRLKAEIKSLEEEAQKRVEAVPKPNGEIEELQRALEEERSKVRHLERQRSSSEQVAELQDTIKGLRDTAAAHEEEVSKLKEIIQAQKDAADGHEESESQLKRTIKEHEQHLLESSEELRDLKKLLQVEQTICAGLRATVSAYEKDIGDAMTSTGYGGPNTFHYIHDSASYIKTYLSTENAAAEKVAELEKKVKEQQEKIKSLSERKPNVDSHKRKLKSFGVEMMKTSVPAPDLLFQPDFFDRYYPQASESSRQRLRGENLRRMLRSMDDNNRKHCRKLHAMGLMPHYIDEEFEYSVCQYTKDAAPLESAEFDDIRSYHPSEEELAHDSQFDPPTIKQYMRNLGLNRAPMFVEEIVRPSGLLPPDSSLKVPHVRSTSGLVTQNKKPDSWTSRQGSELVVEEEKKSSWWWPVWSILWGNTFS